MQASFSSFGFGLGMALVLLYLVMVAQFRSFLDPFIIMFSVPMGLIGVVAVLLATGTTLNIESFMGTIVMVGIVVSNSILLVDFANQRRREGAPLRRAVVEASRIRMRPIVMTALATVVGLAADRAQAGRGLRGVGAAGARGGGRAHGVDDPDAGAGAGDVRAALRAASGARMRRVLTLAACLLAVLRAGAGAGIGRRTRRSTRRSPTVTVTVPERGDIVRTITLPGDLVGLNEAALYAKVTRVPEAHRRRQG